MRLIPIEVLQLAHLSGLYPIITTASPRNADLVKSRGATHVVDRHLDATGIISEIRKIVSAPLNLVYDAISTTETQNLAYTIVGSEGKLFVTLPSTISQTEIPSKKSIIQVSGKIGLDEYGAIDEEFFNVLPLYLKSGEIKVRAFLNL